MTISIEDHAAMRLSGRLVAPMDCTCDEYATVIVSQDIIIKRLRAVIKETILTLQREGVKHGQTTSV